MSDFSTKAMEPKEQPKTCGTCASYYEVRPTMRQGSCFYDELDDYGCSPLHDHDELCDKDRWEPIPLTIEQRYQHLEQVAREMLNDIKKANQCAFDGHTDIALVIMANISGIYTSKLEALGVIVDE